MEAFTASGIGAVEAASRAAGLQYERIVESIDVGPDLPVLGRRRQGPT